MERITSSDSVDLTDVYKKLSVLQGEYITLDSDVNDLITVVDMIENFRMYYIEPTVDTRIYFNCVNTTPFATTQQDVTITLPSNIIYCYFVNCIHRNMRLDVHFSTSSNYYIYFFNCKIERVRLDNPFLFYFNGSSCKQLFITTLNNNNNNYPDDVYLINISGLPNAQFTDTQLNFSNLSKLTSFTLNEQDSSGISLGSSMVLILPGTVNSLSVKVPSFSLDFKMNTDTIRYTNFSKFLFSCRKLISFECYKATNVTVNRSTSNFSSSVTIRSECKFFAVHWSMLWILKDLGLTSSTTIKTIIINYDYNNFGTTIHSSWITPNTGTNNITVDRISYLSGPQTTLTSFTDLFKSFLSTNSAVTVTNYFGLL